MEERKKIINMLIFPLLAPPNTAVTAVAAGRISHRQLKPVRHWELGNWLSVTTHWQ